MPNEAKNQAIERLKQANNVLVTASNSPSVDQLAAVIGLTLLLNKLGKHTTAVFSGNVPSTIEFLKPGELLEKTADSLRDFIISLDKSKADKLRYKVEDKVVKIFITPYRTTISEKDLDFSQGDFNVDVVLALGVHQQPELDQAITAHGRILHDATVIAVNNTPNGDLGSINWVDATASSISELAASLGEGLGGSFDGQMANAFLTGIVAETQRFSNQKATPSAIAMASRLVAAGADPQLIAKELEDKPPEPPPSTMPKPPTPPKRPTPAQGEDQKGTLQVEHNQSLPPPPKNMPAEEPDRIDNIEIDTEGTLHSEEEENSTTPSLVKSNQGGTLPNLVTEPPTLGAALTANAQPEALSPSTDPMSQPASIKPLLSHDATGKTLTDIEKSVASPHLNNARGAVSAALNSVPRPLEPIVALNAQPVDLNPPRQQVELSNQEVTYHAPTPLQNLPPSLVPPSSALTDPTAAPNGSSPPPPVPPPLMPPVL